MAGRDRRSITFEQFAKPQKQRRSWRWGLFLLVLVMVAGVAGYFVYGKRAEAHSPPPALSSAGAPIAGEAYQWAHVAIGGGGFITGLSFDPAMRSFVVRTDVYGAYIWDMANDRWRQLVTAASFPASFRVQDGIADGAYEVAVAPSRPDRVYVAIKGQVFRSDDRGQHFELAGGGNPFPLKWDANGAFRLGGPYMAVDPSNPDVILLGAPESGLWRSADGGRGWQRVASVPLSADGGSPSGMRAPAPMIWFEPAGHGTGRVLVMVAGRGMSVSTDHGATFRPLSAQGAQPMRLRRGVFARNGAFWGVDDASQSIWSYEAGQWRDITREFSLPGKNYAAIAANPVSDHIIVFDQGGAGFQSVDGGKHWTSVTHGVTAGDKDPPWLKAADAAYFATADIAFDLKAPNRLWVAGGMGVFYADIVPGASVVSWVSQARGIEELVANDAVQPTGQSPLLGGWDFGVHVKDRLDQFSTTFGPNERALISVQQMDWSAGAPSMVVTNASDARLGCCDEDGNAVMAGYSDDGGRHWSKFASLPTPPGTRPNDSRRMSFGSIAVSAGDPDNIVWAPAFNRAPFYTKDRGRNWSQVVLPGSVGDAYGSFEHNYYQRKTVAADRVAASVFYLYHSGDGGNYQLKGLWRTRDGGAHWAHVFNDEIAPASNMAAKLRAVPGHEGHLFFTSAFAHVADTQLRRSLDGGTSWAVVPNVTRVDDIAFGKAAKGATYPAIYISGQVNETYGIWRSTDNAASWQRLIDFPVGSLDQVTALGADPDVFGRVYVGYKGSGWIWGEPASCSVTRSDQAGIRQCYVVSR